MELRSNYYIKEKNNPNVVIIFEDSDPRGVSITIKNNNDNGGQETFSLCRVDMIEALEYVLRKIKAREVNQS